MKPQKASACFIRMNTAPETSETPKLWTKGAPQEAGIGPSSGPKSARNRTVWLAYLLAMAGSFFLHELGHCAAAWMHGYPAIPTPMKEYLRGPVLEAHQNQIALGGIAGSILAVAGAGLWFNRHPGAISSAQLAGTMVGPGFYALRFVLAGRGHDGTEFQEAQAALGLWYGGHALDWFFIGLLAIAAAFWFWRTGAHLSFRLAGRLLIGAMVGVVALAMLQKANNAIFDPIFEEKPVPTR